MNRRLGCRRRLPGTSDGPQRRLARWPLLTSGNQMSMLRPWPSRSRIARIRRDPPPPLRSRASNAQEICVPDRVIRWQRKWLWKPIPVRTGIVEREPEGQVEIQMEGPWAVVLSSRISFGSARRFHHFQCLQTEAGCKRFEVDSLAASRFAGGMIDLRHSSLARRSQHGVQCTQFLDELVVHRSEASNR